MKKFFSITFFSLLLFTGCTQDVANIQECFAYNDPTEPFFITIEHPEVSSADEEVSARLVISDIDGSNPSESLGLFRNGTDFVYADGASFRKEGDTLRGYGGLVDGLTLTSASCNVK